MVPSKISKKKLTYNQLRQAIQKIILREQKANSEVLSSEDVNLFIKTYMVRNTKK